MKRTCAIAVLTSVGCLRPQVIGELPAADVAVSDAARDVADGPSELEYRYDGVAAGGPRSCALVGGYVLCWGDGASRGLGRETALADPWPTVVPGVSGVTRAVMGSAHTCALTRDGGAWCWGDGVVGQLGDDAAEARATPRRVPGLGDTRALAAGGRASCAADGERAWRCWGSWGVPGTAAYVESHAPRAEDAMAGAAEMALASTHVCGRWDDGTVRCRGANTAGQLGDGTMDARSGAAVFVGLDGEPVRAARVIVASSNTCVVLDDRRRIVCRGVLGLPTAMDLRADEEIVDAGVGALSVCALLASGRVRCAGDNASGQLGDGTREASRGLVEARLPPGVAIGELAVSGGHACARERLGRSLWCWGSNAAGQLGLGHRDATDTPQAVTRR